MPIVVEWSIARLAYGSADTLTSMVRHEAEDVLRSARTMAATRAEM